MRKPKHSSATHERANINQSMAPVKTNKKICSTQVKENTELSQRCALCAGVVGHRADGLSPGRTVGLCTGVVGHRTDGLSPGRTDGLCTGVVGIPE